MENELRVTASVSDTIRIEGRARTDSDPTVTIWIEEEPLYQFTADEVLKLHTALGDVLKVVGEHTS